MKRSNSNKPLTLVSLIQKGIDIKENVLSVWRSVENMFPENLKDKI